MSYRNHPVNFFKHFLENRQQCEKFGGVASKSLDINIGVPQGSSLSCTLYAIYTADYTRVFVKCSVHYYADDMQVYLSTCRKDIVQSCCDVSRELTDLEAVALQHSLLLNPSKCNVMLFGKPTDVEAELNSVQIKVGSATLPIKSAAKNLGIVFDRELRFSEHISQCVQKAYVRLKLLYGQRHYLSRDLRRMLTDSLVLSLFGHGDVFYGNCLKSHDKRRVQLVQN